MTIPPKKLQSILLPGACFQLRAQNGAALGLIDYSEAIRHAIHGEIEGVCTPGGKLKYVRVLPDSVRGSLDGAAHPERAFRTPTHPLNAVTNLGAYLQELSTGKVWALKLCRRLDGAMSRT